MKEYDFLNDLNEKQKYVCVSEDNFILTACPGSGKTRTLTYRLAFLCKKFAGFAADILIEIDASEAFMPFELVAHLHKRIFLCFVDKGLVVVAREKNAAVLSDPCAD